MFDPIDDPIPGKGKPPSHVLHPVRGVVWAAFWGTPIAAGVVMAINYWRVGRKAAAWYSILIGTLATVALFAIIAVLPSQFDKIPNLLYIAAQLVCVYFLAKGLQSGMIEEHRASGGRVASAWPSVGIGLLCLPVVLALLFGTAFVFEPSYGTVVKFGNDEIYYAGDATATDANRLADVLKNIGYFKGTKGVSVRLESASGKYTVSFIVIAEAWNDPRKVQAFREIGREIAASGFPSPLRVQLCNDEFESMKTIDID